MVGYTRRPVNGVPRRRTDTADVAELVDALDLGSSIERCESSSLSVRTNISAPDLLFPPYKVAGVERTGPPLSSNLSLSTSPPICGIKARFMTALYFASLPAPVLQCLSVNEVWLFS